MIRTYSALNIALRKELEQAGIEAARLEAREIVCAAAEKTKEQFYRDMSLYASEAVEERCAWLMKRRLAGEPVAYITGKWEFYGIDLEVNSSVLIPRVDTEVLAEEAIALLKDKEEALVLDLCCGSGCIGISIAVNVPGAKVMLADMSDLALSVAERNIAHTGLSERVAAIKADALKEPPPMKRAFDMIVCNPPYIPAWEIDMLDVSVKDYEPHMALDGGEDGFDFFDPICFNWKSALKRMGYLIFECGIGQADKVAKIMKLNGYVNIRTLKDTGGVDRVVIGQAE